MSAAEQHILRTYFQVQQWKNNLLNPTEWGWVTHDSILCPVQSSSLTVVPGWLQETIFCKCKGGCKSKSKCVCRKFDMPCSEACGSCHAECTNNIKLDENNDSDSEF